MCYLLNSLDSVKNLTAVLVFVGHDGECVDPLLLVDLNNIQSLLAEVFELFCFLDLAFSDSELTCFLDSIKKYLLALFAQRLPLCFVNHNEGVIDDVLGQYNVLLNLIELHIVNGTKRVLLCINYSLLKSQIQLAPSHSSYVCTNSVPCIDPRSYVRATEL